MKRPLSVKLFFSFIYLGILFLAAGYVLHKARSFDGIVVLQEKRGESWAARPASEKGFFSLYQRGMPAELIGFDNPRAAASVLGNKENYDAARLPFKLFLDAIEILERPADRHVLEITHRERRMLLDADPGKTVDLPEGPVTIKEIKPWSGLVRNSRGTPMALVALQRDGQEWQSGLFVGTDTPLRPQPDILVQLRCYPSEAAAKAAPEPGLDVIRESRWGVREEGRIHWFNGLTPGTGVTTGAGVEFTLLETVASESGEITQILVGRKNKKESLIEQISANGQSPDGAVLFEYASTNILFTLRAWRDGAVLAAGYLSGARQAEAALNEGDIFKADLPEGGSLRIRLDQMVMTALPVHESRDGVKALILETPRGVVQLREGTSAQLQETGVCYHREKQPPVARFSLRALFGKGVPPLDFSLAPGESREIDSWRFYNDSSTSGTDTVAVLRAKHLSGASAQYLGMALFMLGSLGLCFARFSKRRAGRRYEFKKDPAWQEIAPNEQGFPDPEREDGIYNEREK